MLTHPYLPTSTFHTSIPNAVLEKVAVKQILVCPEPSIANKLACNSC